MSPELNAKLGDSPLGVSVNVGGPAHGLGSQTESPALVPPHFLICLGVSWQTPDPTTAVPHLTTLPAGQDSCHPQPVSPNELHLL